MPRPDFDNFSIHELMESINKRWFSKTALQIKTREGWNRLSYVPLGERAVDISSSLLKLGMEKGDRAAVLSESRPEWGAALFGIISCGGIVVPMDVKLSEKEMAFILKDSGARFIFVSEKYLPVVDSIKAALPELRHIFAIDDTDRQDLIKTKELKMRPGEKKYLPLTMDDTAVIVYTSGTTGVAKGVEITYKNLIFQARELNRLVRYNESDNFLSMLPLNHMLELTGGFLSPLYVGATVTYCDSLKPSNIMAMMAETRTTAMITVPLILKMFHDGIMKKAQSRPFVSRKAFFTCLHLCRFLLRFRVKAGRLFFGRIHRQFGGRLRCFVSGGAPLDTTVEMDFNAMGFTILQGYGLTETSPVIAVNTFEELKYGSVGKPLPGVEVKLIRPDGTSGDEGEIVTRGDHVMKGYFRNPEKTAEVIKDGWLYTGDIGKFDKDGFLYITGRIRNLIVLGGGKKVFPEEIEEVMSESPYIKEICVLGRKAQSGLKAGTEEVFAVIVPALEMFRAGAKYDKEAVKKKIGEEITRLGGDLAEYKKISDYMLYFDELPKTSTRKVKRAEVKSLLGDHSQ
ncbi:MAG: AMP-binding protein [Candidatus Omnitrophota bacterium]